MKTKTVVLTLFVTLVIIAGGVLLFAKGSKPGNSGLSVPADYEYFWSSTCPHCARVQEFMDQWKNKDKVKIEKIEVNASRENSLKFIARGEYCKFPKEELGVPLLVTPDGLCISGDQPIIDHFNNLKF